MEEVMNRARASIEASQTMSDNFVAVTKEKAKLENKLTAATKKVNKLASELSEERQLNECLRKNQDDWHAKLESVEQRLTATNEKKDKEIAELKEELRDLMFFVEAQSQIAKSDMKEEIEGGNVVVGEAAATATPSQSKSQKGRKRRGGK